MSPLMDKHQLAELLNVPVSWVERATAARKLPIAWVGKHARYDLDDIRAWIAKNKEMPADELAPVLGIFRPKPQPQPSRPPQPHKPPAAPSKPRPPSGPRRADGQAA